MQTIQCSFCGHAKNFNRKLKEIYANAPKLSRHFRCSRKKQKGFLGGLSGVGTPILRVPIKEGFMTREFITLLGETTSTTLDCFKFVRLERGLLTGSDIVSLWRKYYEYKLTRGADQWRGVYFIFYGTSKEHLVPVYVGQGELLKRIVRHLVGAQYVDQVLAFHFGGIHSRPWLLEAAVQERFRSLSIGMALANSLEIEKSLERNFIDILRPITNTESYTAADLDGGLFGLEKLAERWLSGSRVVVPNEALGALRSAHEDGLLTK
jgi:hypothetical protein